MATHTLSQINLGAGWERHTVTPSSVANNDVTTGVSVLGAERIFLYAYIANDTYWEYLPDTYAVSKGTSGGFLWNDSGASGLNPVLGTGSYCAIPGSKVRLDTNSSGSDILFSILIRRGHSEEENEEW